MLSAAATKSYAGWLVAGWPTSISGAHVGLEVSSASS